ncbi:MAG TPA: M1 family aminopeptidase, partial [Gemmatimonadales bacterium]|nr:M1 family aminopeptidase [Gemmatimonadales bacterium]
PPRAPADTARARTPEGVIRRLDVTPDVGTPYYRRDFYGESPAELGAAEWCGPAPAPGRKRMVWRARDVHHFALSMSPAYRYEGGRFRDVAVHVLYQPGDEPAWGGGIAVERTVAALTWLDGLFGAYPWPQITNLHRIEGGGTEFPMMVHNGSAGFGLIVHEVGHNYLMGILANNEWREGFLDEGFTSWQTGLLGSLASDDQEDFLALDSAMRISDLDGWSEPTSLVSERYRDFNTYGRMIYDRGALFFYHLHRIVGDSAMSRILRTYYDRWKLRHVDEDAFRAVAEEVSGRDLSTFFRQWLHEVTLYDYAVGRVRLTRRPDSGWETRVEVVRKEPGIFPVEIVVRSEEDSARVVSAGVAEREWVTVATRGRPREVVLNPRKDTPDWDALDDRKTRGIFGWSVAPHTDWYLDTQFSRRSRRDRRTTGLAPTVWYNDHGGVMVGARARTDYLGRFDQNIAQVMGATERSSVGWEARLRNPRRAYVPRMTQTLDLHHSAESRSGAALSVETDRTRHRTFGPRTFLGGSVRWMETVDTGYLDLTRWENGGFVEGTVWLRSSEQRGRWNVGGRLDLGGGLEYRTPAGGEQAYLRITAEASARRALGTRSSVAFRTFGGWIESGERTLRQRRLFLSGADPVAEFRNPFLRSRGSLLAGHDVHYHLPGGGNVRGLLPGLTASRVASLGIEVDHRVFSRSASGLLSAVRIAGFADGALADGDIRLGGGSAFAGDAGVGLRAHHRIGDTRFVTRFDLPLLVSRPALAVHEQGGRFRFRYVVSFEPAF